MRDLCVGRLWLPATHPVHHDIVLVRCEHLASHEQLYGMVRHAMVKGGCRHLDHQQVMWTL